MRKVLINLDRSTERLETFYRMNKHIKDVERFSAVDGKGLRSSLKESGLLLESWGVDYSDGALGCALSHRDQWRCAISSGGGRTVIEDDAVFCKNFEEEHQRLLETLPETWDIVLWGYCADATLFYDLLPGFSSCTANFNQESVRKNIDSWSETSVSGSLFKLLGGWGIPCYSISPRGAEKFLDLCFPIRPLPLKPKSFRPLRVKTQRWRYPVFNDGIDCPMTAFYPELEAYVCIPPLVVTPNDKVISTVQVKKKIWKRLKKKIWKWFFWKTALVESFDESDRGKKIKNPTIEPTIKIDIDVSKV
ncbi:MAG: glycosyltransferase family 25 protein [Acetobacter sp.]|nr:glycosyltransferase family 25 protein [Acetobacter sp.]